MDFVTITFNHPLENELLKIQAYSFKFVKKRLINRIIVVLNDTNENKSVVYNKFFKEIISYYPENIRDRVILLSLNDIGLESITESSWYTQQICKIYISKNIKTEYYVLLDAKNHFIRDITEDYFLNDDGRILLYKEIHNGRMLEYYNDSLKYFNQEVKEDNISETHYQSVTPYVMVTDVCKGLINYIETENKSFAEFFLNAKSYTEFFLYEAYLLFTDEMNVYYHVTDKPRPFSIIGNCDPEVHYNNYDSKHYILSDTNVKTFGIHRDVIPLLSNDYKLKLIGFYLHFYDNKIIGLLCQIFFS